MVNLFVRFQVRDGARPELLQATRAYQRKTRREAGNVRCELLLCKGEPGSLVLWEAYRDSYSRTEHALAPHTTEWRDTVAPLLTSALDVEEFESLLNDPLPPPLPVRHRPAVESSIKFGAAFVETKPGNAPGARNALPQFTLDVEVIEVAAARDHLPLRAPDPCVVIGAFVIDERGAHGIGRTVYRFKPAKKLPASLVGVQRLLDVPVPAGRLPLKIGLVLLSVEENGGSDVQALYQELADAQDLCFWSPNAQHPAPVSLTECHTNPAFFPNSAQRVQVLRRSQELSDTLSDDTWAGAALGYFELTQHCPEHLARFHTASEDRKNDWLFTLRFGVSLVP